MYIILGKAVHIWKSYFFFLIKYNWTQMDRYTTIFSMIPEPPRFSSRSGWHCAAHLISLQLSSRPHNIPWKKKNIIQNSVLDTKLFILDPDSNFPCFGSASCYFTLSWIRFQNYNSESRSMQKFRIHADPNPDPLT